MIPELETSRLILRAIDLEDADATQHLFPHWDVVRFLASTVPWPYPADGALVYYRDVALPAMERGDGWYWSLRLKSDPQQMIGNITLITEPEDSRGFWIGKPWWGQGFASEASAVVTDFWFDTLGFPLLRVSKAIENIASRRITEREGMRLIATENRQFVSGCLPSETWEITAEEWRNRRLVSASSGAHGNDSQVVPQESM